MLTLGVIGWIIIGGLAGWVGSKIMGTDAQMGLVLNIVVGIVGGLIGGFLLDQQTQQREVEDDVAEFAQVAPLSGHLYRRFGAVAPVAAQVPDGRAPSA